MCRIKITQKLRRDFLGFARSPGSPPSHSNSDRDVPGYSQETGLHACPSVGRNTGNCGVVVGDRVVSGVSFGDLAGSTLGGLGGLGGQGGWCQDLHLTSGPETSPGDCSLGPRGKRCFSTTTRLFFTRRSERRRARRPFNPCEGNRQEVVLRVPSERTLGQ